MNDIKDGANVEKKTLSIEELGLPWPDNFDSQLRNSNDDLIALFHGDANVEFDFVRIACNSYHKLKLKNKKLESALREIGDNHATPHRQRSRQCRSTTTIVAEALSGVGDGED